MPGQKPPPHLQIAPELVAAVVAFGPGMCVASTPDEGE